MLENIVKKINAYHIAIFFAVMFTTMFLTLNFAPVLTKYGDSNAETPAKLNINIEPTMSISSTTDNISLNLSPNASGAFSYGSTDINITSNNLTGYYLTLSTATDDTALNLADSSDSKIASLESDATVSSTDQSSFTMNSWGYTTENNLANTSGTENTDTTFHKVSGISNPDVISNSNIPGSTKTTVTFATRVNPNLMSGVYTNTVVFTAVSNTIPDEEKNFFNITTMQDMTAEVCNTATTPTKDATESIYHHSTDTSKVPTTVLTDTRDNETYIVRKLADGNCWMSQNLRIVGSRTLTSADSDVSSNFTLPATTTSGYTSSNYYLAQVGPVNSTYGNGAYYSWTAATAGTGTSSVTSGDAPSSVCPKGWRLPPYSGNKSYRNLITTAYGYSDGGQLTAQPLQFAYGGLYNGSSFDNGGSNGYYWSSTAGSSTVAYNLYFYSSYVRPQDSFGRYNGFSVRCVNRSSAYTVSFNAGEGQGSADPIDTYVGEKIDLSTISSKFSKPGYKLTGWKDQYDNTYATDVTADVNPENKGNIVLTAIWGVATPAFFTISTMQEMTSDICASATTPNATGANDTIYDTDGSHTGDKAYVPQVTLKDARDNNTYIVRKLADGNCWMSQDLRIVGSRTLTSADSDIVSGSFSLPTPNASGFSSSKSVNIAYTNSSYGNGVHYTWCAVTANSCSSATSNGAEAVSSICPKGWRLPPNSGDKSFGNLFYYFYDFIDDGPKVTSHPFQYTYSGFYNTSSAYGGGGANGHYWSSTAASSSESYRLIFLTNGVLPQVSNNRFGGLTARCVAR